MLLKYKQSLVSQLSILGLHPPLPKQIDPHRQPRSGCSPWIRYRYRMDLNQNDNGEVDARENEDISGVNVDNRIGIVALILI